MQATRGDRKAMSGDTTVRFDQPQASGSDEQEQPQEQQQQDTASVPVETAQPDECPECAAGVPLSKPGSRPGEEILRAKR